MPAGLALLETGLCRAKNAAHAMSLNLLAYLLAITAFWAVGFAFMCGGAGHSHHSAGIRGHISDISGLGNIWGFRVAGHWCGIIGGRGFFLASHLAANQQNAMFAAFFCMMVYAIVAVAIPNGALLNAGASAAFRSSRPDRRLYLPRLRLLDVGRRMAQLGQNFGLGNGGIDYSGSMVVHLLAGTLALTGAIQIGITSESTMNRAFPGRSLGIMCRWSSLERFCSPLVGSASTRHNPSHPTTVAPP